MSVFRKTAAKGFTREEVVTNLTYPAPGSRTALPIGQDSSMRLTAVYASVRYIAETVASLPVHLYRRDGDKRTQLPDPAWLVKPNPETTRFEFFEATLAALNLDGNAFWYYETDRLGRVAEVWNVHPGAVHVRRRSRAEDPAQSIEYRIGGDTYDERHIVHMRAFRGSGGLRGLSPIELFREGALRLAASAEEYATRFFDNNATPPVIITVPAGANDDDLKRTAASWKQSHQGLRNAHEPGFLTGGATAATLAVPNDDAQFIEGREFSVTDIARIFRVPPHKIADLKRATFSNIEHSAIEAVTDCIRPWCVRVEIAASPLVGDAYMKFGLNGLLRGDTLSRFAAYNMGIQGGWLNPDEPRAWEDLDPIPDGKGQTFRAPLNLTPVNGDPPAPDLTEQVNAASTLVRSGYDPQAALAAVGLDPIAHLGLLPVTVQPVED